MGIAALIITAVYGAAFIIASLLGLIKTDAVHQIFMISTASLAAALVFLKVSRLKDMDAMFAGALGIASLAVSRLYGLTYLTVYGDIGGITVGHYTQVCSTLFFISAVMMLLLPPISAEKAIRFTAQAVSAVCALLATYAVIAGSELLLYIASGAVDIFCAVIAAYLFYQSKRIRQLSSSLWFSCALFFFCLLDIAFLISSLCFSIGNLGYILAAPMPLCCAGVGLGLYKLRGEEYR